MDDPYRSSQQTGECPRCQNPTRSDGELGRLACVAGCGEWYPREILTRNVAWHDVARPSLGQPQAAWPWTPARCPTCRIPLVVGFRDELRYDYCASHGVWLDAGEIERFAQVFKLS